MAKTIRLKYPGTCVDCGSRLTSGTRARWFGRGRVSGLECHERAGHDVGEAGDSGLVRVPGDNRVFARTRRGLRAGYENTGVRCEDAPCCGCCG